jgi:hypothetical protein
MIYLDWNATTAKGPKGNGNFELINCSPTQKPMSLTMPVEIGVFWPILRITGQKNPSPLEIREALSRNPVFYKLLFVDQHPIFVIQRP